MVRMLCFIFKRSYPCQLQSFDVPEALKSNRKYMAENSEFRPPPVAKPIDEAVKRILRRRTASLAKLLIFQVNCRSPVFAVRGGLP